MTITFAQLLDLTMFAMLELTTEDKAHRETDLIGVQGFVAKRIARHTRVVGPRPKTPCRGMDGAVEAAVSVLAANGVIETVATGGRPKFRPTFN